MPPIIITVDHPTAWTDILTAVGTVGTAVAAVIAIGVTVCQARTDRKTAARRLAEEQERHRTDLVRADHLRYLLDAAEQYARYRAAGRREKSARTEAEARLQLLLRLLPHDNAVVLRYQFRLDLTDKEKAMLADTFPQGIPAPDRVPEKEVYNQLAHNARSISRKGRR